MKEYAKQIHDSLYAENGGHVPKEGGSCDILLKKRYTSVVHCPGEETEGQRGPGTMYPRCICLEHNGEKNGTLLATMEYYTAATPVFPIFESTDEARSWHCLSSVEDTQLGWGMRFQPHLYELPCDMGDLKEGTILCAGNAIPRDMSMTALHLYKSEDCGRTWTFMSEIVRGERDESHIMGLPVWEPFLLVSPDNRLFCYYSDERFKKEGYNQLLAHKVSEDGGYMWSELKIDVAWIPQGGKNGTILVTGRGFSHIFANSEMGMGFWEKMESLIPIDNNYNYTGYSQCLVPLDGGRRILNVSPCQISNRQALIEAAVADVFVRCTL